MATTIDLKDVSFLYMLRVGLVFDSIKQALKDGNTELIEKLSSFGADMAKGCDPYIVKYSDESSPYVKELIEHANMLDWNKLHSDGLTKERMYPQISAGEYEGVVLQSLARPIKPKRILEIGMFIGASTLALADLPCVEKVVTLDIEPYLEVIAKPFWEKAGVADKINPIFGNAVDTLKTLANENQQFDFIFLDAPGFLEFYEIIMDSGLLSENGMLVKDDTIFLGLPWVPQSELGAMDVYLPERLALHHKFNERVKNDDRVHVVVLPARNGMSIITRRK